VSADPAALVALAARLGRENFAPRADRWDREASFPFENYADLRAAGLLGLCVPERHGGLGADFRHIAGFRPSSAGGAAPPR
jgi:alkylation response protein AidB-like acyl-CoA dehydrogenase